jgi:hypothetical protein
MFVLLLLLLLEADVAVTWSSSFSGVSLSLSMSSSTVLSAAAPLPVSAAVSSGYSSAYNHTAMMQRAGQQQQHSSESLLLGVIARYKGILVMPTGYNCSIICSVCSIRLYSAAVPRWLLQQ